jgi:hypothetical protein
MAKIFRARVPLRFRRVKLVIKKQKPKVLQFVTYRCCLAEMCVLYTELWIRPDGKLVACSDPVPIKIRIESGSNPVLFPTNNSVAFKI